ncbi:MAG TPA: phage holin family protein [Dermatophilaceae bacterium]|nr:phage holin family protein [Dermatophilaceae bacterium]
MSRDLELTDAAEPTIGQLVASASRDVSTIVRSEIALAKAEVTQGLTVKGKGGGMLAAAGVVGIFALAFLLTTLAWGIVALLSWPVWAGFGIVTLLLLLLAAILALVGKKTLAQGNPKPERAIAQAEQTVATLKSAAGQG